MLGGTLLLLVILSIIIIVNHTHRINNYLFGKKISFYSFNGRATCDSKLNGTPILRDILEVK